MLPKGIKVLRLSFGKRRKSYFPFPANFVTQKLMLGGIFKAGVHLKAVFTPLKIGSTEISRSRFKQYKNRMLITQINVLE